MTVVPTRRAWAALFVLTAINLVNYIDRLVVPAVGESIKHSELHTTDTQFGLLASAFLIVYMCTAPIFGGFGDRPWRLRLVTAGVASWSVATAVAGLAHSYPQLVAARASVGIGEAAYSAIAPAVLADYFPERLRGRVFAVFYAAIPVGSALGYILGGFVDQRYGWRVAFFVAGVPGLVLSLLVLLLADPAPAARAREAPSDRDHRTASATGFGAYGPLLGNRPYLLTVLGYVAYTFAFGGLAVWMPTFLARVRHVPLAAANAQLGGVLVVTGFVGTFAGGWMADGLMKRTRQGYLWLSGVTMLLAVPLGYIALTTTNSRAYWVCLIVAELLIFASTGPINSAIVGDVPPTARAAAMAGSIFVIHLLGDVPSPPLIGWLSDHSSLEKAVLIIPAAMLIGGIVWTLTAWLGERDRLHAVSDH